MYIYVNIYIYACVCFCVCVYINKYRGIYRLEHYKFFNLLSPLIAAA